MDSCCFWGFFVIQSCRCNFSYTNKNRMWINKIFLFLETRRAQLFWQVKRRSLLSQSITENLSCCCQCSSVNNQVHRFQSNVTTSSADRSQGQVQGVEGLVCEHIWAFATCQAVLEGVEVMRTEQKLAQQHYKIEFGWWRTDTSTYKLSCCCDLFHNNFMTLFHVYLKHRSRGGSVFSTSQVFALKSKVKSQVKTGESRVESKLLNFEFQVLTQSFSLF